MKTCDTYSIRDRLREIAENLSKIAVDDGSESVDLMDDTLGMQNFLDQSLSELEECRRRAGLSPNNEDNPCVIPENSQENKILIEHFQKCRRFVGKFRHRLHRYQLLAEAASEGILIHENYIILDANQKLAQMLGYNLSEIIGKNIFDFVDAEYHDKTLKNIDKTIEEPYEIKVLRKDGTSFTAEIISENLTYEGKSLRVNAVKDITQRKQADEASNFRIQFENLITTISTKFINLKLEEIDSAILESLEKVGLFTKVDRICVVKFDKNKKLFKRSYGWNKDDSKECLKQIEEFSVGQVPWFYEKIRRFKKVYSPDTKKLPPQAVGEAEILKHFDIRAILCIPLSYDGKLLGFLSFALVQEPREWPENIVFLFEIFADIISNAIARKKIEGELSKLYSAISQSPNIILITNTEGLVEYANPQFEEFTGYKIKEILGKKPTIFTKDKNAPHDYQAILKTIEEKGAWQGELLNYKKNGEAYWEEISISPIKNHLGETANFLINKYIITDRKNAEDGVIRKTMELQAIFHAFPDLFFRVEADGKIIDYITGNSKNLIMPPKEFLEKNISEVLPPHVSKLIQKTINKSLKHKSIFSVEYPIEIKGQELIFEARVVPFSENQAISIVREITDNRRGEEALRKSEERYRGLIESQWDLIARVDAFGRLTFVNDAYCKKFGKTREEIIGTRFHPLLQEEDKTLSRKILEKLETPPYRIFTEQKMLTGEGWRWIAWEDFAILDKKGKILEIQGVGRDITERKEFEDTLKKENTKLSAIISNIGQSVLYIDAGDTIMEVNDHFCDLVGGEREDFLGKKIGDLLTNKDFLNLKRDEIDLIIGKTLDLMKKFKTGYYEKTEAFQRAFLEYEVMINIKPVYRDEKYEGIVLNIINVTDLVKAKLQSEEARQQAEDAHRTAEKAAVEMWKAYEEAKLARMESERANRFKSEFLANMSHEIRTPMNAILGFSETLLEKNLGKEERKYVEFIKTSGNHLLNLINDILDLSKVEAGRMEINETPLDIREIVKEAETLVQPRLAGKEVKIKILFEEDIPRVLFGDQKHIKQVLLNLLSNAAKFTINGSITVTVSESDNFKTQENSIPLQITIKDTGIGISKDKLKTIFDPFDRGGKSTNRDFDGTGLGLSITRKLAHLMGGTITAASEEGVGSTFTIILPLKKSYIREKISFEDEILRLKNIEPGDVSIDQTIMGKTQPSFGDEARECAGKILLVEDNIINQELIKTYLKHSQIDLEVADDGEKAVEMAKKEKYDLILMDIQLPKMDGYEATKFIRSEKFGEYVPILALTAHAMKGDERKARNAGFNGYLSKPILKKNFLETILPYLKKPTPLKEALPPAAPKKVRNVDPDVVALLPRYINILNDTLGQFEKALKVEDYKMTFKKGHELKGSGGSFGYDEITKMGSDIEEASNSKDKEKLETLLKEFKDILNLIRGEQM